MQALRSVEARHAQAGAGPLADEDYDLVCLKETLDSPAISSLRRALASDAWAQSLASLPGYGVQVPGQVLSLTRALPWWHFKRAKAASAMRVGASSAGPLLA